VSLDLGIVGRVEGPLTQSWTLDDVARYADAVGAPDPERVVPTFAIVLAEFGGPQLGLPGADMTQVLHAEQSVELFDVLPVQGEVRVTRTVTDLFDKVSGALVARECEAVDPATGLVRFRTRSSLFVRGEGGFGGERGTTSRVAFPDRDADVVLRFRTAPDQALRYRETGDRNPMHWDPAFAARGGFPRPILHGLATYGITCRLLADEFGEPSAMHGRFTKPVFPGDELAVSAWHDGDRVLFRTATADGTVAIDDGRVHLRSSQVVSE
jgi:acyl dehydratase